MKDTKVPKKLPTIVVVCGPTATGKSALAIEVARHFRGEIISADSRQVYTSLNIGTGKITKKEMRGIPHYLLDVAKPSEQFSVEQFKKLADEKVVDILARGKVPIICGGTGFYINSLVDNISLPNVLPNKALRKKLGKMSAEQLFKMLQKLDPKRVREIDQHNHVRLIRAIEIAGALGKVPSITKNPSYRVIFVGIDLPDKILQQKILTRLTARIKKGMVAEAQKLHKGEHRRGGLSWSRMNELGLEYRYLALFLQKKISRQELVEQLNTKIWQYAKRQRTWFKRDKRIRWFRPNQNAKIFLYIKARI